jgi:2-oxoglutarate ferredoxin oxidoreductase subunit alpha
MIDKLPPLGGIALQCEDEIASIGACLGASMAGMKVMTATSGPGISLMSENISFAIAGEIPIVIVNVMRQGPSTGSATRGADGDVHFMRWGNSGGLPIIVLAPTDVRDCFTLTVHAFNLAERFRCPVFVGSNKEVGMTRESCEPETIEKPPVVDRVRHEGGAPFLPFAAAGGQDVPAFLPIGGMVPVRQTSSTHGADGYITTDPGQIQAVMDRLERKIAAHRDSFTFYEQDLTGEGDTLIVTYGVTARAARDAVKRLRQSNIGVSLLNVKTLWPVPDDLIRAAAAKSNRVLVLEMNQGQYVWEVRRVLCSQRVDFFGKMCGELITPAEITAEVTRG